MGLERFYYAKDTLQEIIDNEVFCLVLSKPPLTYKRIAIWARTKIHLPDTAQYTRVSCAGRM